jgi:endothelin-converting enzyme
MDIDKAAELAPEVGLHHLIKSLAPSDTDVKRVIVTSPSYLKALPDIISEAGDDVVRAYFAWKVIQSFTSSTEAEELKPYKRFRNKLEGKVR